MSAAFQTPVVLLIYKRPDVTRRVFEAIARAKPSRLFVVADGPRHAEEAVACDAARAVVESIDWDCEVHKNYADTNMGLKRRVSSGLDWVFEQTEQAIILEDDCLPDPTFFPYCEELLQRYRDDPRVMHIGGSNLMLGRHKILTSYAFARFVGVWGWATWRRAWKQFDGEMKLWAQTDNQEQYLRYFTNPKAREAWRSNWNQVVSGQVNTWGYPWFFTCLAHDGLAIIPQQNLITNIGFGAQATHTRVQNIFAGVPTAPIKFPLVHPSEIAPDAEADEVMAKLMLSKPFLFRRVCGKLARAFPGHR